MKEDGYEVVYFVLELFDSSCLLFHSLEGDAGCKPL